MIKTNYHTHNELCDGQGPIEDYISAALEKGMAALGFSSHAPLPVENDWVLSEEGLETYLAILNRLKNRQDGLQIYTGLEIDYIPGAQAPGDARWDRYNLDYKIGSVHSTMGLDENPDYLCVDGPEDMLRELLDTHHGGRFEHLCETYYTRVAELCRLGGFDILGHIDLVKKRNRDNRYFTESASWYVRQVRTALESVARSGVIMEINSGAISRGALDEVYPSPWILSEARKLDIPVMVNADAHRPQDIDCHFEESCELLKETGYKAVRILIDSKWQDRPL